MEEILCDKPLRKYTEEVEIKEEEEEKKDITTIIKELSLENIDVSKLPIDPVDKNIPNLFAIPQCIRPLLDGDYKDTINPDTGKEEKVDFEKFKFCEVLISPYQDPDGTAFAIMCVHKILQFPISSIILLCRGGELSFARLNPYRFKTDNQKDKEIFTKFVDWIKIVLRNYK